MSNDLSSDFIKWFKTVYEDRPVVAEFRDVTPSPFGFFALNQKAGAYPDPPTPNFILQVADYVPTETHGVFNLGDGAFKEMMYGGYMLLAPPSTSCNYEVAKDFSLLAVSIPSSVVNTLLHDASLAGAGPFESLHRSGFQNPFLSSYVRRLWSTTEQPGPLKRLMLEGALTTIVASLLQLAGQSKAENRPPRLSKSQVQKVLSHLETHLDETVSVKTLANLIGLSEFYFTRAFKASLGSSPYRFLLNRRLEVAKHLLLTTKMPLAEVALAVGFSSQAHFSSTFKRLQGVTPGAVRRG